MPQDEFDLLLNNCRDRLSEIRLRVPDLDATPGPAPAVYSLAPAPAVLPPPAPARPAPPPARAQAPVVRPAPQPAPRPAPPPAPPPSRPEPKPLPVEAEPAEIEIFPPLVARPRKPLPSAPLWADRTAPEPPAAAAPRPTAATTGTSARNAAIAAVAAVAAGAYGAWLTRRPADLSIPVDQADALAVRSDKGDLLVAEGGELVDLERDGRVLRRAPLEAPVTSLRWTQGSLWSVDGRAASVTERPDGARTTVFPLNHVPQTIFVKDAYLWTVDGGNTIRQFLISRSMLGVILQPLEVYVLPKLHPETFALDDAGLLWVVDSGTRRLYRLRAEGGSYTPINSAALSPLVGPVGIIRSLTPDNGAIWLLTGPVGGGPGILHRISLDHLDWKPE